MALLSSLLRKAGHRVLTFDLNNALYLSGPDAYRKMWDDKDLYSFWGNGALIGKFIQHNSHMIDFQLERILNSDARVIGFTVHFSSLLVSLELARRIKRQATDRIIIFGGPDCSRQLRGNKLINDEAVDAVIVGEGDETLLELLEIIDRAGEVGPCAGTLIKNSKGDIIDCGDRDVVIDLDALPFPDYTDFSEDISWGLYRQPERLEVLDSRGCITKCHFCSEWQFWKRFRSMSGERIFAEISHQVKKFPSVNYFYFIGSLLNGSIKALSRFCDLVIENGLDIRWSGQAVVSPAMTRELLQKMRRSGCEWLGIGIESGSERLVRKMNKHFTMKNARQMLKDAHDAGIQVQVNFMFGLPTETEEDFKKTLEFLRRNRENIDSVLASQSFCVIDKGTYLHTHAEEFGISDQDHHLYWQAEGGNTYPERFRRYEEFCQFALSLGLPETSGVLRKKPDKWLLLGDYYYFKKDYQKAIECYQKSKELESADELILQKIETCRKKAIDLQSAKSGCPFGGMANG
jgi:radical SAM superfamily enzyme YgiQ (UPF0313 family)